MPELPEVEGYRQFVDQTALNQPVLSLEVEDERLLTCSRQALEETVLGKAFTRTSRVGKYLFLHTDADQVLMMHFGMTGKPAYFREPEAAPRFTRVTFALDSGFHFGFVNMRKFGRLDVDESVLSYRKRKKLGPDALEISREDFVQSLLGRDTLLKPALLLQNKFAGIGNWIADEMLFQVGIHPEVRTSDLERGAYERLYDAMQSILREAIAHNADYEHFPDHFMTAHRWGDGFCPKNGQGPRQN
jgi:formamidopyrimidine-DNA glycosylase